MMRYASAALFWIAMTAPIQAAAEAAGPRPDSTFPSGPHLGEDLFKWGEYDSLIRILEPVTAGIGLQDGPRTAADSAVRAKSYLFLGVAFYATGKREQSDSAFARACDLDPLVKLDRFYVTEEIANHFQAIAMDGIRNRKARTALTLASHAMESRTNGDPARVPPVRASSRGGHSLLGESQGKGWLWWGLGVTALAAAGGGAYYISSQKEPASDLPPHLTTIDAR